MNQTSQWTHLEQREGCATRQALILTTVTHCAVVGVTTLFVNVEWNAVNAVFDGVVTWLARSACMRNGLQYVNDCLNSFIAACRQPLVVGSYLHSLVRPDNDTTVKYLGIIYY